MPKALLESLLRFCSAVVLRRHRPTIIGITGSVGKTGTKEAVFAVLQSQWPTWRSVKSYNTRFGVPLTILGAESGLGSFVGWVRVVVRAIRMVLLPISYPRFLVLEIAADRPGDILKLIKLAPLDVGVITALTPAHTEFFGSVEGLTKEKEPVVANLAAAGTAVLNADDRRVFSLRGKTSAKVLTYGFSEHAEVRGIEMSLSEGVESENSERGMSLKIVYRGNAVPVFLPRVIGVPHALSALAATAVGLSLGINLLDIAESLRNFAPPPGRMNLLPGIKNTWLIDDSYNASPMAVIAALDTLEELQRSKRRIAALGEMAELGELSEEGHRDVGKHAGVTNVDMLLTVGKNGKLIADAAKEAGLPEDRIFSFDSSMEAGKFLQDRLEPNDLVLVKGSQVSRMEKITKEIMADPGLAGELLVRQGKEWQKS